MLAMLTVSKAKILQKKTRSSKPKTGSNPRKQHIELSHYNKKFIKNITEGFEIIKC